MSTFSTMVGGQRFLRRSLQPCCVASALLVAAMSGPLLAVSTDEAQSQVSQLLTDAAQAEVKGDVDKSAELIREALRVDSENQHARWQSGQIQVDKQWVTVDAAQKLAAADPLQSEYRERRAAAGDTSQGQLALAKWCRKNNLVEEALYHWASVLAVDSKNEEALRALDLHWQGGRLLSREQIADYKDQLRDAKRAAEYWAPKLVKWRRGVSGRDATAREAALAEIRGISRIDSIAPLEQVTLGRDAYDPRHTDECSQISLAYLEAIGGLPDQAATESIARHVVFAPVEGVRKAAIDKLKPRDMHDYVPMLLGGLSMPIETNVSVLADGRGNVYYGHSYYQEGAESDQAADTSYFTLQHSRVGRDLVYRLGGKFLENRSDSPALRQAKMAAFARNRQFQYANAAAAVENRVASANERSEMLNARIYPALNAATGKNFNTPRQWWDYWRDNNEYYSDDRPVDYQFYSDTDNKFYGKPYDTLRYVPSCFVKGTPVWTKTGRRPIESLELGDLVLTQNVNTGELKYAPIIGRTVRPPSSIIKLTAGNQVIRTTRGHLFWVAGTGWQMSKELKKGSRLHGLGGGSELAAVESDGEAEAYNLVIADVGTYFVGDQGLLVHDNTPRMPTRAIVPGVLATK